MTKAFIVRTYGTGLDWIERKDMQDIIGHSLTSSSFSVDDVTDTDPVAKIIREGVPKTPRYSVGELHGSRVVWEMNECDGMPDPRPLSLDRIAEMLNGRTT